MQTVRVIPCLDMKDGRVVKGVHFVELRDAADPVEAAKAYSDDGAVEYLRSLGHDRADEETSVAPPRRHHQELSLFQALDDRCEIVEDVLLKLPHARPVPSLAVLGPSPQVRLDEDAAVLHKGDDMGEKPRGGIAKPP